MKRIGRSSWWVVLLSALPMAWFIGALALTDEKLTLPLDLLVAAPLVVGIAHVAYPSWVTVILFCAVVLVMGAMSTGLLVFYYLPAVMVLLWTASRSIRGGSPARS